MDSRELTYFVAVAEELNFGRAATRLGIAQPPLSRTIQQLERRLGITLFTRTSRSVALTAAGEVLLYEGKRALEALTAAGRRAQRAGDPGLVLAMKATIDGDLLEKILAQFAADPAAVEVEVRIGGIGEQAMLLRAGEADAALLRLPHEDADGLAYEELLTEPDVAVLPRTHRLAVRDSITMSDLDGEQLPYWPGSPPNGGPLVRDAAQLMQLISLGRTVALLPASVQHHLRTDLTTVPVTGAATTTLVIAWSPDARSHSLAALVQAAVTASPSAGPFRSTRTG
ncbi:LysR family transcriptional regulator [Actinokineospora cianjurensis]|uniref:DNA-binding transcriptional LysR family regulator n=1 Tax=Actinokineospora cianjurensis TaxID=585224 RepID=A0A421AVV2_9PSEU|nr:LysR family transcriptional regulator [Actinokineospora cianjurensis]RLK53587.1 DNA-binding transcriptional LysR family regulator [Actinokineospora cianjurensis]